MRYVGFVITVLTIACAPRRPMTPRQIVEESKPAVVRIEAGSDRVGTGFVVSRDGLIATNLHVVAGAEEITVILLDGTKLPVTAVVAVDNGRDLVVLRVASKRHLRSVRLGDSSVAAAGDPIVAIGNPLGVLDYTVSDGLISSVRKVGRDLTVLQISAPISQGSSGGPLFNGFGEVVGVTTAIMASGQNLNFAVPSNYLQPLVTQREELTMAQFGAKTRRETIAASQPVRSVPLYDVAVLEGCSREDIMATGRALTAAIQVGAPLFDDDKAEACYRVFDGTALRLERDARCAGLRAVVAEGLVRADAAAEFEAKAWALRDTFDGLIDVLARRARAMP